MRSKWAKNIEKNKNPLCHLCHHIIREVSHCLPIYWKSGFTCCSPFLRRCYGCLCCCQSTHYCWGKPVFLYTQLGHQITHRKLKSSSSSPKLFCAVLQSIYYFFMTIKEKPCCFSRPRKKAVTASKSANLVYIIFHYQVATWKQVTND